MRYYLFVIVLFFVTGCEKYKDPAPFSDPRIVNKYCNIPSAINFNWDFPGIEDNSTCIFPAQLYNGIYKFYDTTYGSVGDTIATDSFLLTFTQIDSTRLRIEGFCTGTPITATANRFYKFTIDSLVKNGQILCGSADTIEGMGTKADIYDTTTLRMSYEISNDTLKIRHAGMGIKQ